jgi:hypothetical protein
MMAFLENEVFKFSGSGRRLSPLVTGMASEPERRTMFSDLHGQLDRWLKNHAAAPSAN